MQIYDKKQNFTSKYQKKKINRAANYRYQYRETNSEGSRPFNCLFTLIIRRQSFLLANLTTVRSLSFRRWQVWMSRSQISTPISWITSQTFCSRTLSLTDIGIPITSNVSLLEYWAFSQHWPTVATTLLTNLLLTFVTIATSASNFFRMI